MQYQKTAVRERILEAARTEFAEFGFASASVRNIADSAGASMGNLYRYFENKEALFRAVVGPFAKRVTDYIAVEFEFGDRFLEGFAEILAGFLEKFKTEAEIIWRSTAEQSAEFFSLVAGALAKKAERHVALRDEKSAQTLHEDGFFETLAACFCYGIREILRGETQLQRQQEQIRRLAMYLFGDIEKRAKETA